ncbi:hypothetical protein ACLMJK_002090 [Lecanora helva]
METIRGLNTNGPAIIATGVVFTVCSAVAVGLRFSSKRITNSSFKVDDWLLLASLLVYITAEVLVIRSDVVGRQAVSPTDDRYKTYQKYVYIYSIFYFVVVGLAQASILLFYRHIFYPTHLRYTSIILLAICAAWCITALIIEIGYPGHPISYFFPGSSTLTLNVTYLPFWLAMALIESLIQITILILPVREIIHLQLSLKKKMLLTVLFALGGFVIITGIVRMAVLYRPGKADFDLTQGDIWLNVHLGTVIISACLPALRPLVSRKSSIMHIIYPSRGSYQIEDTDSLHLRNRRNRASKGQLFTDDSHLAQRKGLQGNFVDAQGRRSLSTVGLESLGDGAVEAGTAIGVKQTVDVV